MKPTIIKNEVTRQLPNNEPGQQFYTGLLENINNVSPINSFLIGLNTGQTRDNIQTNATIIKFDKLPLDLTLRKSIIDILNYHTDEYPEFRFIKDQDILFIAFDF